MVLQNLQADKTRQPACDFTALSPRALERWHPQMRGPHADGGITVIDIYDVIGFDPWTGGGVTAAALAGQIRGKGDLVININSPGGDFFEGLAIHNLLRVHAGHKTVNIIGLAASAASLIAAAGDDVLIAASGYVMIHNVWGLVVGDKTDMAQAATEFEKFDAGARGIYVRQTGKDDTAIAALMDAESWFLGQEAVDEGFATGLLPADAALEDTSARAALAASLPLRHAEAILSRDMTRREARALLNQIKGGTPDAAAHGTPDAAVFAAAADGLRGLLATFQ